MGATAMVLAGRVAMGIAEEATGMAEEATGMAEEATGMAEEATRMARLGTAGEETAMAMAVMAGSTVAADAKAAERWAEETEMAGEATAIATVGVEVAAKVIAARLRVTVAVFLRVLDVAMSLAAWVVEVMTGEQRATAVRVGRSVVAAIACKTRGGMRHPCKVTA